MMPQRHSLLYVFVKKHALIGDHFYPAYAHSKPLSLLLRIRILKNPLLQRLVIKSPLSDGACSSNRPFGGKLGSKQSIKITLNLPHTLQT